MAVLNSAGQLLLPLVGVTRDDLRRYKVEVKQVGFRYSKVSRKTQPYTIYIRIARNEDFVGFLDNNRSLLQVNMENDEQIIKLECLPDYAVDWEHIIKGRYSKVSYNTRKKILKGLDKTKSQWEKIFRRKEEDILEHIEGKLKSHSPVKRRELAKEFLQDINMDTYELYPKLRKDFV